jgi:hypothetical protein
MLTCQVIFPRIEILFFNHFLHLLEPMMELLVAMETETEHCFKNLIEMGELPPSVNSLTKFNSIGELEPRITRSSLLLLEKEMKCTKTSGTF